MIATGEIEEKIGPETRDIVALVDAHE